MHMNVCISLGTSQLINVYDFAVIVSLFCLIVYSHLLQKSPVNANDDHLSVHMYVCVWMWESLELHTLIKKKALN